MNVLSGIYPHGTYSGEIIYEGTCAPFRDIRDSEKVGIVIIHQELALQPYLSIGENMFLGNERQSMVLSTGAEPIWRPGTSQEGEAE